MTNGHIEIYDPLSNGLTGSPEPTSPSDSPESSMEDTVEYRIMMAYAQRRRPQKKVASPGGRDEDVNGGDANGTAPSAVSPEKEGLTEEKTKNKKKKKKGLKGLVNFFSCVKPQTKDEEPQKTPDDDDLVCVRAFQSEDDVSEKGDAEDQLGNVADRLTEIAEEIPFIPPEIETDNEENEVERVIGLILRESGDRLNERELRNANIAAELFWNYSFFSKLISGLLMKMGLKSLNPESPGPKASPKTQIAVMCEVTSRLSAVDTLPTQRLLDHGARYMQD
ncbi:apoptosis facilitator Bcl-2-like protein 14 [Mugil cephalus]|uniref:apoptosis facilitator Bcl-2-like protein 14 n=1 Tax=Mugil cephalus TaxID=48193 RepID=UPI001FB78B98|nr:apoptosis facilitator Bcl-2-like protein 14 [Mugil cephalus]